MTIPEIHPERDRGAITRQTPRNILKIWQKGEQITPPKRALLILGAGQSTRVMGIPNKLDPGQLLIIETFEEKLNQLSIVKS